MKRATIPLLLPFLLLACEGPAGPAGTPASPPDPAEVAAQLLDDPAFVAALASRMRTDPDLAEQLRGPMGEPGERGEPGGPSAPAWGYVLRDRDGGIVDAEWGPVHPAPGKDGYDPPLGFGDEPNPQVACAQVSAINASTEDRYYTGGMHYDLESGRPEPCYPDVAASAGILKFEGADCTGALIAEPDGILGEYGYTHLYIAKYRSTLYHTPPRARFVRLGVWWERNSSAVCEMRTGERLFTRMAPVPDEALGALDRAPYTVTWELR